MSGIMLGPSLKGQGGVTSVVKIYRDFGLFNSCDIRYLETVVDGSFIKKLRQFLMIWCKYLCFIFRPRIDFVHIHLASRNSTWRKMCFILPAILVGKPYILHLHGAEYQVFFNSECGPLRRFLVRRMFACAATVIVLSTQWKEFIASISNNNNVLIIPNSVPIRSQEKQVHPDQFNLVFLGRLGQRKGIYDLLEAMKIIVVQHPEVKLFCGGDGEVEEVQRFVKDNGLEENYLYLGWVDSTEKDELFSKCDIFVLPSYNEGLPMGILEAMSYGIPVISTRVGGIPDAILDGDEGFLVTPGDVMALAKCILLLVEDPTFKKHMSDLALKKAAEQFSIERIAPRLEKLYESLQKKRA